MNGFWLDVAAGELTFAVLLLGAHHVRDHALADRIVSRLAGDPLMVEVPEHHRRWVRLPWRTRAAVRAAVACGAVAVASTWAVSPLAGASLTAAAEVAAAVLVLRPRRKAPEE